MAQLTRFGRKIALPSTRQIRHELLVMMQDEARLKALPSAVGDVEPALAAVTGTTTPAN